VGTSPAILQLDASLAGDGITATTGASERLTVDTGSDGDYLCVASISGTCDLAGWMEMAVYKNAGEVAASVVRTEVKANADYFSLISVTPLSLVATDYVDLRLASENASQDIAWTDGSASLFLVRVGDQP